MTLINFLLAVVALIIAILAYQKAEGSKDMKEQLTTLRERTADTLSRWKRRSGKRRKRKKTNREAEPPSRLRDLGFSCQQSVIDG